jgi:flagellar FliJ protein
MAKAPTALITLLQLAEKKSEQATLVLAQAKQHSIAAHNQYEQLEQYRREYLAQHVALLTTGVESQELLNFKGFLLSLDRTIIGQQEVVERCKLLAQGHRLTWQEAQRKKMSYEVLIEQQKVKMVIAQAKSDQKLTDEFVNTRSAVQFQRKDNRP